MLSSFFHSKLLVIGTPRTIFKVIIRVFFKYVAIKNPVDFLFLKSEAEEGAIKTHHGPYDYRNIEQKVVEAETCERV